MNVAYGNFRPQNNVQSYNANNTPVQHISGIRNPETKQLTESAGLQWYFTVIDAK